MPKKEFILGKPSLPVFHSEACDSQQHASLGGTGLDSWVFLFAHNTMCLRHLGSADCWPARYSAVRGPRQHSWGRLLSRRRSQICPQVVFKRSHIAKAIVKSFPDFRPCQIQLLKRKALKKKKLIFFRNISYTSGPPPPSVHLGIKMSLLANDHQNFT